MSVLILLIFASLAVAIVFLASFIWAVRSGQYEDTCTPSLRLLTEETPVTRPRGEDKLTNASLLRPSPSAKPSDGKKPTISAKPEPESSRSLSAL